MSAVRRPFPLWPALFPVIFAATYLAARWPSIPETWASHFARNGQPNGWSHRTADGVFGPLIFPLIVIGVLGAITTIARRSNTKRGMTEQMNVAMTSLLHMVTLALSAGISIVVCSLPFGGGRGPLLPGVLFGLVAIAMVAGLTQISAAFTEARAKGELPHLRGRGAFLYHYDPNNPKLWVPKSLSPGYTINYAHPWAWPVTILMVLGPLTVVAVTLFLTRSR